MKVNLLIISFFFILSQLLFSQEANLDCKLIDIGPLRQTVTNLATFGSGWTFCAYHYPFTSHIDFSNIRDHQHPGWSEYPTGSNCWYGDWAPWIGAKVDGTPLVTTTGPEWMENYPAEDLNYELWPSAQPWDTVWVVKRGETVDLPFWQNYTAVSDQDYICRMDDFNSAARKIPNHTPMGIEVIQVTYAWIAMEFLVHQYWIIPQKKDLTDVYFGYKGTTQIGCATTGQLDQGGSLDEFGWYDEERNFGLEKDLPGGGDDDCVSGPIGFKLIPDVPENSLKWTWYDGLRGRSHPPTDIGKYYWMNQGINHDPLQGGGGTFIYTVGPFEVPLGDTLHITMAQIYGEGEDGVYENLDRLITLRSKGFKMPTPPPVPPLRIESANHQITLKWNVPPGGVNPETYVDENRGDGDNQPFEGYRVYKSTVSEGGPWTLLAEYDREDNEFGNNTGLQYEYIDKGLLNNLEYYYTVTSYARPDSTTGVFELESSLTSNAQLAIPGTATPETVGEVAVVPNPYRGDVKYYDMKPAWEKTGTAGFWSEEFRRIQFINLPNPCKITIYTVSGKYVTTIDHNDPERGFEDWNLTSHVGQAIASGVYLYTVEDVKTGDIQKGKFVVIK